MRQPIQPIREEWTDAYIESVRAYVEDRFLEQFRDRLEQSGALMDVTAHDMRDYVKITVFLTDAGLIPDAESFAGTMDEELDAQGHKVFLYVRSWSLAGTGQGTPAG